MKHKQLFLVPLAAALIAPASRAEELRPLTLDVTLYGLAAGMSGDVTVRGASADLDVGFDKILDNLDFGAMGTVRLGHERWALTTDVIYMGLEGSKNNVQLGFDQWVVEPSVSYRFSPQFELLAGARYVSMSSDISVTGPLGVFRAASGTQDWWDPIVGGNLSLPLGEKFSLNVRGDIGGFGVGSDFAWQAYPSVSWRLSKSCSLLAGYRWVYMDYETGSGANAFKYDVLTQGPQLGFTLHF